MRPAHALVVSVDPELARVAVSACRSHDATVVVARDVMAATEAISVAGADVVLLDARGAGVLALCPIVRSLCAGAFVAAAVDPADAPSVRTALDLYVDALISIPVTGDAFLRVLGKARETSAATSALGPLGPHSVAQAPEMEADLARRSFTELRRVVDAAMLGNEELVSAALDAIAEVAPTVRAKVDMRPREDPITVASAHVPRLLLGEEGREVGAIELVGGEALDRDTALQFAGALSSLLALRSRVSETRGAQGSSRVLDKRHFDDVLAREIDKARRHRRSLSLLSLDLATVDPVLLTSHLRASDAVGQAEREVLVLLPETGPIGAARLRRRVTRSPVGTASLPADGSTRDALVRTARARRQSMSESPLMTIDGSAKVASFVDELLTRPMLDRGALAIYPLILTLPAAISMLKHACWESVRRGESFADLAGAEPLVFAVREVEREGGGALGVVEHRAPDNLFALVLTTPLGTWACAGRVEGETITAVHGADPLFGDRIVGALEAS